MTMIGVQRLPAVGPICTKPALQFICRHRRQLDYILGCYKKVNGEQDEVWKEVITVKMEGYSKITKHYVRAHAVL